MYQENKWRKICIAELNKMKKRPTNNGGDM